MAFICLCGQRYESQRHSVGCPRCADRAKARRAKAFRPSSLPQVPGHLNNPRRHLNLSDLPLLEALSRAIHQHIARIGVPTNDVLASGSPVATITETLTSSCTHSDLHRLQSEAANMARNARQTTRDPLSWAIEQEFRRRLKATRTRGEQRPHFRLVSGGLPGTGQRT